MKTFKDLKEFIQAAEKSRKYLPVTVSNLKAPLRLLEAELKEEEKNSVDLIKQNLDQIFNVIFSKNNNLSAGSIMVYKRRIHNLISDYERYGSDPAKMAAWDRNPQPRKSRDKKVDTHQKTSLSNEGEEKYSIPSDFQSVEISLTNGKAKIIVPKELSDDDVVKLKFQIDILANKLPTSRKPGGA